MQGTRVAVNQVEKELASAAVNKPAAGSSARLVRRAGKNLATYFLPTSLRKRLVRLDRKARPIYMRLQIMERLSGAKEVRRRVPSNARRFLTVCFGNIIRSPMAEAMLKRAAAQRDLGIRVCSAGLHAWPGREAHPWAIEASREIRMPLDDHHATVLSQELVAEADAVLAMDFENLAELLARYPEAEGKMYLLGAYAKGAHQYQAIPDPYFGDLEETRRCYALLQQCVDNLVSTLEAARGGEQSSRRI